MSRNATKKLIALCLALMLIFSISAAAGETVADRIHFIATTIKVYSNSVTVEGYFVNLNTGYTVKNFKDFNLYVYQNGSLLISGSFGKINQFSVKPLGVKYQSFTWRNRTLSWANGTYSCSDDIHCRFSCKFKKSR